MARKRRRFTAEFKGRVALEALQERDSVQAIAARHELHPNQVSALLRQRTAKGNLRTTTLDTSISSNSMNATKPSGPKASGIAVAPTGKVPM